MEPKRTDQQESDFPANLSNPARSALDEAGYFRLDQMTEVTEAELLKLHGLGPKTIRQLRDALATRGLAFKSASNHRRLRRMGQ